MCKPASEGGQRCAAHTRKALAKARAALTTDPGAYEAVLTAEAEHASTPTGRREIEAELAAAESPVQKVDLREALRRGDEIRARSQSVGAAVRTPRVPKGFSEVTDPDLEFELDAPDDADGMEMPVFSGTASQVGDRLVPGTYEGATADGRRVRAVVTARGARVFEKHVSQVSAETFAPGVVLDYRGVETTILSGPETVQDRFGRDMMRYRARRADTGAEGHLDFGPGGVAQSAPLTTEQRAKVYGSDFQYAVGTARANTPSMKSVTREDHWSDFRIVMTPTGRLAVYSAAQWEKPVSQPMLPWSPPEGRVVGSVSHVDGSVTRLA